MEKQASHSSPKSQIKTTLFSALILGAVLQFSTLANAQSDGGGGSGSLGGSWGKKAQAREGSRWTLQEWMAQKQRNSLMDQWLSMNSPSPFEFALLGASNTYDFQKNLEAKESYSTYSGSFSAYAQAVGLTGEYENNVEENLNESTGLLNLRILGNSLQSTSITLHVGQRTLQYYELTEKVTVRNVVGQISLQAYLTKYFGLSGSYRHFFLTDHSSLGEVAGTLVEGGLFIDFKGLRIFGSWNDELQVNQSTTRVKTKYKRQGIKTGLVIFF